MITGMSVECKYVRLTSRADLILQKRIAKNVHLELRSQCQALVLSLRATSVQYFAPCAFLSFVAGSFMQW